jgi:uncharacterized membrane protein
MSKARLEAFSDGVLAIAVTLLVLNIHVPAPGGPGGLAHQLGQQWPSYASYAVSFVTIGIIWINHHLMLSRLRAIDHSLLLMNLLLLLFVGLLPFTTALIAEYLRASSGAHLAAAIYAGSFLAMSVAFFSMQRHILLHKAHLLHEQIDAHARAAIYRRNSAGLLPYVIATAAAALSAYLTLAICAAVAVFYALPQRLPADASPSSGAR